MTTLLFRGQLGDDLLKVNADLARLGRLKRRSQSWCDAVNPLLLSKNAWALALGLTYRTNNMWRPNHMKDFMRTVRDYLKDDLLAYFWWAEMHPGGHGVHYHATLIFKKGAFFPHADESGFWPHGMTRTDLLANVSPTYMMKYAQKGVELDGDGNPKHSFPPGLRLFGCAIRTEVAPKDFFSSVSPLSPDTLSSV